MSAPQSQGSAPMQLQESIRATATRGGVMTVAAAAACGYALAAAHSSPAFASGAASQHSAAVRRSVGGEARLRGAASLNMEELRSSDAGAASMLGGAAAIAVGASLARRSARDRQRAGGKSTTARKATITATIEQGDAIDADDNILVKKTSVLVLGATGTLGRQVVRQLLNAGYSVRCIVRNRADRPFSFLVDWGATVVEGSFFRRESLPSALVGIHTVVDCSTARAEESIFDVDWEGKKTFIQCCEKMKVQRYLFVSIKDCDKYPRVPMMNIKHKTEKFLAKTKMRYTSLRVSGYMQPLISQYAVCVLDDQKVWGDDGKAPGIAYIDSLDCARMLNSALTKERTVGKVLTVTGPKVYKVNEIIKICQDLSGKTADLQIVSDDTLKLTETVASFFQWSTDVAERMAFVEIIGQQAKGTDLLMSEETYLNLAMNPAESRRLDDYIKEYYRRVFKKLTQGKYEPEAGEIEKENSDFEEKLAQVLRKDAADELPEGQVAEVDVKLSYQINMADRLQKYYEDRIMTELESSKFALFGLVPNAEIFNARAAMFGFVLGMFTEWATEVSVADQIDQILGIFTSMN